MMSTKSSHNTVWSRRFIKAAIIQGAIVCSLTAFLVLGQVSLIRPEISRVMAAGGAGTWLTFGYVMYILVGVIGVAVSALFYHYLENVLRRRLVGITKALAWVHLMLMNAATIAATGMLMYAGYIGGASMLPENVGGRGFNAGQAHALLAPFVEPISIAILAILVAITAGGIGFLLTYRSSANYSSQAGSEEVDIT